MFDVDNWLEIFDTIKKNKLRTFLTGFSVAWGIFMLIVLLGSGQGLANGIQYQFRDDAMNSLWVRSGQTSVAHKGFQPGRKIQFTNADHEQVKTQIEGVEYITSRFYVRGDVTVNYKTESGSFDIRSVHPDHRYLENTIVTEGRFLNDLDIAEHRKVAAIGVLVRDALFKDEPAIGKQIKINGIAFKVIGLFEDVGSDSEQEKIYLPITTAQRTFNGADRISMFMLTTGDASLEESKRMAQEVTAMMATQHRFSADDQRAIYVGNAAERFHRFAKLMDGIRIFVWMIGLGTILAGVISVSNIMMIVVQDRTREIGVRKALGATPWSIVSLILQESIAITAVAGYIGLVLGVGLLELVTSQLPNDGFFLNPEVSLTVAVQATVLLVLAGSVAGFFPARRAAAIRPIEALREE